MEIPDKVGTEWTRDTLEETGNGGLGKRTERSASGIPVLSHYPY